MIDLKGNGFLYIRLREKAHFYNVVESYNVVETYNYTGLYRNYNVVRIYNGAYDTRCSHLRRCGAIAES